VRSEYPCLFQTEGSELSSRQGQQYNLFFTLQPVRQVTSLNLDDENVRFIILLPSLHGLVRSGIAGLGFPVFTIQSFSSKGRVAKGFPSREEIELSMLA